MKTLTQKQQLINCKALLARMEGQKAEWIKRRVEDKAKVAEYAAKMTDPKSLSIEFNIKGLAAQLEWMRDSEQRVYQLTLDISQLRAALGEEK